MTTNIQTISKEIWGPKAWRMLHLFSIYPEEEISKKEKHYYYIFYKSFRSIIPCQICKIHYESMIEYLEPLEESKISRKYIKRWVWKIHNRVNVRIGKKEIDFKKAMKIQERNINHQDIFFFMNQVFKQLNSTKCSMYDFDQIYHFFYTFAKLYPQPKIRSILKKLIQTNEFENIQTPCELKNWYLKHMNDWQSHLMT
jgi:hypothetical protein